jgi:predicted ATPase/signal transduction histidine kinase/DNA-binding response OmpR family regulator/tRNA A-37 threonylcarbamoyl transferase component Bud32
MTTTLQGYKLLELLHSGGRTAIYRARRESDMSSVIVKTLLPEYPTIEDITRLRHEYKIIQPLNIEGIVKAYSLENYQKGLALIIEDIGGQSLDILLKSQKLPLTSFFAIGIQIANALEKLHNNRIIHKDIKPHNIVVNVMTGTVNLIDFSIASQLDRENASFSHPDLLEGTLAYMSPEQTGRMNRSIDYRTDFYSLGVTFYEMLTGELPFNVKEPLELVHCHIAKKPVPPHHINPEIPRVVSNIVMKLLAKNAEDRYQTVTGLKFDLETCFMQLKTTGKIADFIPGTADKAGQLLIPQKLYGRASEVQELMATFDRVASGTTEMMLVSGYSGIGKTVLVNEVHKPIVRQRGYFIAGKFDQFKRNIPYASLIQAFQSLILQLLTESEAAILSWKENLLSALGDNGQVIIDVIPEVELIIRKQPPVPQLGATESQNRFSRVFEQFIGVFTTKEHPLVVFLDDLQWADSASLKLIELLMTDTDSQYLLLIGAYRDNEVFPAHPTMQTIDKIRQTGVVVNDIVLEPLKLAHVQELIADTLNESQTPPSSPVNGEFSRTKPLAELLFNKTQGNPFFLSQLLKTLYQEDLLVYDLYLGAWQWNIEQIQAIGITDYNVVELIARNIRKLPEDTQKVLKLAACIGNTFNLEVLSVVNEESSLVTAAQLWATLEAGLILPLSNEYKIPLVFSQEESGGITLTDVKVDYKFLHDRVQQAAYSLIPDEDKKQTHLKIGQLLLQNTTPEERKENIFALVNQLNYGTDLLTTETEKYELAQLNLIAGQKAKAATAHDSAVKYLQVGLSLLAEDSWESQYELALALHEEIAEASFLSGDFDRMQSFVGIVQDCAKTLLEKIKVYEVQIQAYVSQNKLLEAVHTALEVLKLLGVEFPSQPNSSDIGQALGETATILKGKRIEDLIDLPQMSDSYKLAAMKLLSSIFAAAYVAAPTLLPLTVCKQVNLSVKYGNASISPFTYANYGLFLCGVVGDIESGYQFGQLALNLLSLLNAQPIKAKTVGIVNIFIRPWKEHLIKNLEPVVSAYASGMETGDLEWAAYDLLLYSYCAYFSGKELTGLEREIVAYRDAIEKIKQKVALNYIEIYWQAILNLLEKPENPSLLKGKACDEESILPLYQQANDKTAIAYIYWNKLLLSYWFENYSEAIENTAIAENYLDVVVGLPLVPIFHFYDSLVRLAVYIDRPQSEQKEILERVQANQEKMQKWAHHAPMNHLHKYYLVEAERHRILGEKVEAIEMYDKAIALAKENEYINEEALAHELAAKFYLSWGKEIIAQTYMTNAYYAYIRWGALAKVEDLEKRYPQLLAPVLNQKWSQKTGETIMQTIHKTVTSNTSGVSENFDLATVMKASLAISGEIVLANLLEKLMKILIENAGAETGTLILSKNSQLVVEARGNKDEVHLLQSLPVSISQQLSISVLNYVARTQKDVILNDASNEDLFNADPYITQYKPKSLLCTPIISQGKLTAILYLENNLTVGAFTPKRVEVLQLLSGQAAIAIENANLYHTLEIKVEERTQQLQEKNAALEIEIKERQRAEQAAEAANHAKSQFLANMSHELRTPLNGILGYAQILKRDKNLTSQQNLGINIVNQCGEHLLTLINDILDLSKIEAGKIELYPTNLHLGQFLGSIAEICRIKAEQKGIALIYKPLTVLPAYIQADEKRLRQVIINLLGNAVKFTTTGGVTLKVAVIENNVQAQNSSNDAQIRNYQIRFQVEDTGVGIAPEQLIKIFLPFEQVGETVRTTEGTGLGLAISRQLVEIMGGELKVESSLGKGSVFWFDLEFPEVKALGRNNKESQKNIKGFAGKTKKILVVDDKWENRSVLVNLLSPVGFEILEATDGDDCLNKAIAFQPDCILIDLVMPVMDGFETMRRIRKLPELKGVVVIATSASIFNAERQGSLDAGCHAFISKPIRAEEIFESLERHLNLEWTYEKSDNRVVEPQENSAEISNQESNIRKQIFVAPPEEELSILLDLAMLGDLRGISEQAEKLKHLSAEYIPFATYLSQLAQGFEEEKILHLIQQYMES